MSRRPTARYAGFFCVLSSLSLLLGACSDGSGGGGRADQGPRPECDYVHSASLSADEPAAFAGTTEAHNEYRHRVGTAPLRWDSTIAAHAQEWADDLAANHGCGLQHSSNAERSGVAGFSSLGQNLAGGTGSLNGVSSTHSWASERSAYDFGTVITDDNFRNFGHYTQVVWDDTTALGCGQATCGGSTVVVCEYGVAGNFLGQAPYGESTGDCLDLDNDDILQVDDRNDLRRN